MHLAILRDADIHMGRGRTNGIRLDFSVALTCHVKEGFGLPVELLQVQPKRAVEAEELGADGFSGRVGDPDIGKAKRILQRLVNEKTAEAIKQLSVERHLFAMQDGLAMAPCDRHEGLEQPTLQGARILHADGDAGE